MIFDKIKKNNKKKDPSELASFGEFVHKFYSLLGHVQEIELNQ